MTCELGKRSAGAEEGNGVLHHLITLFVKYLFIKCNEWSGSLECCNGIISVLCSFDFVMTLTAVFRSLTLGRSFHTPRRVCADINSSTLPWRRK